MRDYSSQNFLDIHNGYVSRRRVVKSSSKPKLRGVFFGVVALMVLILIKNMTNKSGVGGSVKIESNFKKNEAVVDSNIKSKAEAEAEADNYVTELVEEEIKEVDVVGVQKLIDQLEEDLQDKSGIYGLWVKSFWDGQEYGFNQDEQFLAASINKIPIITRFLLDEELGRVSFGDVYKLSRGDLEEGSGSLQYQKIGSKYTFRELLKLIGKESDNTATNAIVSEIGRDRIQDYCDQVGMEKTKIVENQTTPREMGGLLAKIYEREIFDSEASRQLFFDILTNTDFEERIPAGVPGDIRVAHKIGNQIQVWSDCGVVMGEKAYAICILTKEARMDEAEMVVPEISKRVWEFENSKK